ncbi:hypothetical protein, partial [Escherichia coli]|uniref:hypothetical protein n=2 Tax=Escherichia coli TaxID=562 RepID=UPI0008FF6CC8
VCRDLFFTDSNDACQYIINMRIVSVTDALLRKKQPALTFGEEVLAQKDRCTSHVASIWRYIF